MKLFTTLRGMMAANEYSMPQLARKIGLGRSAMSERLNGHKPFTLEEAYTIMKLFHIPVERLHEIFPPDGKHVLNASDPNWMIRRGA